jgi:hypothetical protein
MVPLEVGLTLSEIDSGMGEGNLPCSYSRRVTMTADLIAYLTDKVNADTEAYLGGSITGTNSYVADALASYGASAEADVADEAKYYAIGCFYYWQHAWEYITAGKFAPEDDSAYKERVDAIRELRDYYAGLIDISSAAIIVSEVTNTNDPYLYPRSTDRV